MQRIVVEFVRSLIKMSEELKVEILKDEIIMTIPDDGPSELLAKAKDTKSWDDLMEYLVQLERALVWVAVRR